MKYCIYYHVRGRVGRQSLWRGHKRKTDQRDSRKFSGFDWCDRHVTGNEPVSLLTEEIRREHRYIYLCRKERERKEREGG